MAVTVTPYPVENIYDLDGWSTANDLTVEVVETRVGKWYAKINAYIPAYYSAAAGRSVTRTLIVTEMFSTQELAQAGLANLLTSLNTIEIEDGTKLDISQKRINP